MVDNSNKLRLVVITGALRGLGFELSKCLIRDNQTKVILTSRDASQAKKVVDQLKAINTSSSVEYHQLSIDLKESVDEFVQWVKQTHGTIDVLVNNAAVSDFMFNQISSLKQTAKQVLNINVTQTINLSEAILPVLSMDGKIVMVSSLLGRLYIQGESIQKELSNPEITIDTINQKIQDFILMRKNDTLEGWQDYNKMDVIAYNASKCLLNAYSRFILAKNLPSNKQTVIVIHPGWCQTEMGGPQAPLTPEQGTVSMLKAINDIPYGQSETYNGISLDEKGDQWDY